MPLQRSKGSDVDLVGRIANEEFMEHSEGNARMFPLAVREEENAGCAAAASAAAVVC